VIEEMNGKNSGAGQKIDEGYVAQGYVVLGDRARCLITKRWKIKDTISKIQDTIRKF